MAIVTDPTVMSDLVEGSDFTIVPDSGELHGGTIDASPWTNGGTVSDDDLAHLGNSQVLTAVKDVAKSTAPDYHLARDHAVGADLGTCQNDRSRTNDGALADLDTGPNKGEGMDYRSCGNLSARINAGRFRDLARSHFESSA